MLTSSLQPHSTNKILYHLLH